MDEADAADAAVRQAEAEGLTMQPSGNATGYRGVRKDCRSKSKVKPFFATVWRAGKTVYLGAFATAEEAALAYARAPEARAQVAAEVANRGPLQSDSDSEDGISVGVVEIDEEDEEETEEDEEMGRTDAADAADSDDSDEDSDDDKPAAKPAATAAEELEQEEDPPASSPAAAKRAAPPPKSPPAKQPRHTLPLRPVQPAPLPQGDASAPQAYPTLEALAAPAAAAAAVVPASQQLAQLEARLMVAVQPGASPEQRVQCLEALLEVTAACGLPTRVVALVAAADAQGW